MPFPVDIRYINEAEKKLGVKFPPSYVVRIVRSNGGQCDTPTDSWELYPIFDTSDKKRLKRTCNDVVRQTMLARQLPHFPTQAVAIGANGSGDELVFIPRLDVPTLLAHEVYWWDHKTGEVQKIADDFADYDEPTSIAVSP